MFRSQGSSPSQRFSSPQTSRVCFTPERSWDSPFRAFPSERAGAPFGVRCPLAVHTSRHPWLTARFLARPLGQETQYVGFRVFFSLGVRSRGSGGLARPVVGALLGFFPLQGFVPLYDATLFSPFTFGRGKVAPLLGSPSTVSLNPSSYEAACSSCEVGSRFAVPGPLQSFRS